MATILYRALGGKENMDKIWPLHDIKPTEDTPVMTKEFRDKMIIKQALINKQIKEKKHNVN